LGDLQALAKIPVYLSMSEDLVALRHSFALLHQNGCAHKALVAPRSRGPDESLQAHGTKKSIKTQNHIAHFDTLLIKGQLMMQVTYF